jgi:hypothetical protein
MTGTWSASGQAPGHIQRMAVEGVSEKQSEKEQHEMV